MQLLDEAVEVLIGLMTTDGFTYSGQQLQLRDATLLPRPVQQPHIPIWIGGTGERRTLPLVARLGDAWHGFGGVADLSAKSRRIDELAGPRGATRQRSYGRRRCRSTAPWTRSAARSTTGATPASAT